MSTAQVPSIDTNKLNTFISQFVTDLGAAVHVGMVVIGEKLGLYKSLAAGTMSCAELSVKTKTDERFVREWLSSHVTGGYITYNEKTCKFSLSEEQAFTLANENSPAYIPEGVQPGSRLFCRSSQDCRVLPLQRRHDTTNSNQASKGTNNMKRGCKRSRNRAYRSCPPVEEEYVKTLRSRGSFVQERRMFLVRRLGAVLAAGILSIVLIPRAAYSQGSPKDDDRIPLELSALGKHGDTITRAREQVLEILQQGNACTVWFQESDHDPAEVFRSLHFELERSGPSRIYGMRNVEGKRFFKHPWAARSMQYAGRGSTIQLNANGPFFNHASQIMQLPEPGGMVVWPSGNRLLTISSYNGDTPEAQITILLHELGHIVGRLPEDDDSWNGRSSRNSEEVLRHCKHEVRAVAQIGSRGSS